MQFGGIANSDDRKLLIEYLKTLAD
jgi:cytochrome c2